MTQTNQSRRCRSRMPSRRRTAGFSLIEVMVTALLMMVGLLGMVGVQSVASNTEFESYQRGQALALAREMGGRIAGSRGSLSGFLNLQVSSTDGSVYVGTGAGAASFANPTTGACDVGTDALTRAKYEVCQWSVSLKGTAATDNGSTVGAMLGARGCLLQVTPAAAGALADFFVVVVWQGVAPRKEAAGLAAGDATTPVSQCAQGTAYGTGLRRGVALRVLVPDLAKAT